MPDKLTTETETPEPCSFIVDCIKEASKMKLEKEAEDRAETARLYVACVKDMERERKEETITISKKEYDRLIFCKTFGDFAEANECHCTYAEALDWYEKKKEKRT